MLCRKHCLLDKCCLVHARPVRGETTGSRSTWVLVGHADYWPENGWRSNNAGEMDIRSSSGTGHRRAYSAGNHDRNFAEYDLACSSSQMARSMQCTVLDSGAGHADEQIRVSRCSDSHSDIHAVLTYQSIAILVASFSLPIVINWMGYMPLIGPLLAKARP